MSTNGAAQRRPAAEQIQSEDEKAVETESAKEIT
jgi:hypothetical protein